MRWGPVVASVVSAFALIAAAFVGISAWDSDAGEEFGLVRLDGLVGETLLLLAVAFVALGVAMAKRRAPAGAFIGVGLMVAVVSLVTRWSLSSDAESVTEYIAGAGSANGIDSRLVSAVDGTVTRVDVDPSLVVLAMACAAALVAVGWAGWVELDERRRPKPVRADPGGNADENPVGITGGNSDADVLDDAPDAQDPGPGSITDSSQVPHT